EFKLQSGVFVRVSTLRVAGIDATSPLLRDLVITGADERYVGALAWLNLDACRESVGLPDADFATLVRHPALRQTLIERLRAHNARNPGSSMQIRRILLLETPPCVSSGEINDKGYINQRKVLDLRREQVAQLYGDAPDACLL